MERVEFYKKGKICDVCYDAIDGTRFASEMECICYEDFITRFDSSKHFIIKDHTGFEQHFFYVADKEDAARIALFATSYLKNIPQVFYDLDLYHNYVNTIIWLPTVFDESALNNHHIKIRFLDDYIAELEEQCGLASKALEEAKLLKESIGDLSDKTITINITPQFTNNGYEFNVNMMLKGSDNSTYPLLTTSCSNYSDVTAIISKTLDGYDIQER